MTDSARPFYLAGEWRTSDDPAEIRSPFDGRRVARVHRADEAQASEAADKALEAFPEVRRLSSQQRSEILLRLRDGVAARRGEIEAAMVAESGKPVQHVRMELGRGLLTLGRVYQAFADRLVEAAESLAVGDPGGGGGVLIEAGSEG